MADDKNAEGNGQREPNTIGRILNGLTRVATSWIGLVTAYLAAVAAAVVAWQRLPDPLNALHPWVRGTVVFSLPALLFVVHGIPTILEQRRKKQLTQITGKIETGYFSLRPREDEASFVRSDGEHQEILQWIERRRGVLYLTGLSGTGKSSLLSAWVIPHLLADQEAQVIRLRGYQDPLLALQREMLQPGAIWQKPPATADTLALLERACRYLRPRRLVIVFDQFEEFVLLQNLDKQQQFSEFLSELSVHPVEELTLLLVLRSDYIGLAEKLGLPPLLQDSNWKEVPPFTERAAQDFVQASGLKIDEKLLRDVLREAGELERTRGIIRPITVNLCGLVLARFATGLHGGFRPGVLIRGFLRESILLPELHEVGPKIISPLISSYATKQPRTIAQLAQATELDAATVLGCLRRLGQSDRCIVRSLDTKQELWEISHDFLVPLLDSIVARWRVSFWKRLRAWLPWITAVTLGLAVGSIYGRTKDPIAELADIGWTVSPTSYGVRLEIDDIPPKGSLDALRRIRKTYSVRLHKIDSSISEWHVLNNLTTLDLSFTQVSNVEPLKDLRSLTTLDLSYTPLSDIGPLKGLTSLRMLDLKSTNVSDVRPLQGLTTLTMLNLSYTPVEDAEPLKDLRSLTTLDLAVSKVSNVGPLQGLMSLSTLDLSYTPVSDVEPLKNLKSLTSLSLFRTRVITVAPLNALKNLRTLTLSRTQVGGLGSEPEIKLHFSKKELKDSLDLASQLTRRSDRQVSDESLTSLKKSMPNLQIDIR